MTLKKGSSGKLLTTTEQQTLSMSSNDDNSNYSYCRVVHCILYTYCYVRELFVSDMYFVYRENLKALYVTQHRLTTYCIIVTTYCIIKSNYKLYH